MKAKSGKKKPRAKPIQEKRTSMTPETRQPAAPLPAALER
jgi:hypothetical protein